MSEGLKYDDGKCPLQLISSYAITQLGNVLAAGAVKYTAENWRGGINWSRVIGASLRHIFAFKDGEDRDPETGLSHLAHASACLMFLLEYEKTHTELDDRYKIGGKDEKPMESDRDGRSGGNCFGGCKFVYGAMDRPTNVESGSVSDPCYSPDECDEWYARSGKRSGYV